jgi:hypothetical protein
VELLAWFDGARARLVATFRGLDPGLRVPWFGPPMSAASALTARIMETWAHGQDVADALGAVREPTARLRHVAHIGVGARAYSYAAHGRAVPDAPVRVELTAPDGSTWTWGPAGRGRPGHRSGARLRARDHRSGATATTSRWRPTARTRASGWRSGRPSRARPARGGHRGASGEPAPGADRQLLGVLRRPAGGGAGHGRRGGRSTC